MYCDGEYYPFDQDDSFYVGSSPRREAAKRITTILSETFDKIPGDSLESKLDTLNKCNCCERHKTNRPKAFESWVDTPFRGTQDTTCSCECRHLARFICRQAPVKCEQKPMLERWKDDMGSSESPQ